MKPICHKMKNILTKWKCWEKIKIFCCPWRGWIIIGLWFFLERPIILEISRWDRLKGWTELLQAFADIKLNPGKYIDKSSPHAKEHERFIERMGLVLAGPDSSKIADDPEGLEVFISLVDQICSYPKEIQDSIALLSLPLDSRW